jgi:regulator of sigma E protease
MLPLGGYVKFLGDADASSSHVDPAAMARLSPEERRHSFHAASVGRRALTVAAGPFANFLLTIVIFAAVALVNGAPARGPVVGGIGDGVNPDFAAALAPGDRVLSLDGRPLDDFAGLQAALLASDGAEQVARVLRSGGREETVRLSFRPPARIDAVVPGGAAEEAGLAPGDVITAIDGRPVDSFSALQRATAASGGRPIALTVQRGAEVLSLVITPRFEKPGDPSSRPLLGIQKQSTELTPHVERVGPLGALGFGLARTWDVIALSLGGIWEVVTGAQKAEEVLGGPIRIAEVSGQAASQGLGVFIGLIAVLSTSIGLINLFPVPILDGGHLVFYAVEKLRGAPLRERWQEIGNRIGLALVLMLMIFATLNDIARL